VFFNDAASNGINIIACGDGGVYAGTSLNYLQQTSRISVCKKISL
jgi:NADPH-dependent curcumin reductase CurA